MGAARTSNCMFTISAVRPRWNWTTSPSRFPLLSRVDSGGDAIIRRNWIYREATVDSSDGRKLTIRFTNDKPAMELKSSGTLVPAAVPFVTPCSSQIIRAAADNL